MTAHAIARAVAASVSQPDAIARARTAWAAWLNVVGAGRLAASRAALRALID